MMMSYQSLATKLKSFVFDGQLTRHFQLFFQSFDRKRKSRLSNIHLFLGFFYLGWTQVESATDRDTQLSNRFVFFLIFRDFSLLFAGLLVDPLMPALRKWVYNRQDEVENHSYHEYLKHFLQEISFVLLGLAAVKFFFLVCEESLERLLHLWPYNGNESNQVNSLVDQLFAESYDHDDFLQVHFDNCLPDERCTKECPEWH